MDLNNRLSRRKFLGNSLTTLAVLPSSGLLIGSMQADVVSMTNKQNINTFSPFIEILVDDSIHLIIHKQEMGQNVRTSLAMLLAEELEVSLEQITLINPLSHPDKYGRMDTGGSGSVYANWMTLRQAGATAREMLISAAAKYWSIKPDDCISSLGKVINQLTKEEISYGKLSSIASKLKVPINPILKTSSNFNLIGSTQENVDIDDIITGKMVYGMDVEPDDCLYATIIRCPSPEGTLQKFDSTTVTAIKGIISVKAIKPDLRLNGNRAGVGIIAKDYFTVLKAKKKLSVKWDIPKARENGPKDIRKYLSSFANQKALVIAEKGNAAGIKTNNRLDRIYHTAVQSQAQIEPMTCTAKVTDTHCHIWAGHQFPQTVSRRVAEFLSIPITNVIFNTYRMGGSFGRKYENDFVMEAVQLAKGQGVPIKVIWTREDDMQFGFYQTPGYHELSADFDENNQLFSWQHNSVTATYDRTAVAPIDTYDAMGCGEYMLWELEHYKIITRAVLMDLNRGAHRSVGNPTSQFAIGSFQHELASHANEEPLAYFLKMLGKDRILAPGRYENPKAKEVLYDTGLLRECINRVATISKWGSSLLENEGMGFSAFRSQRTYCATVVKVRVIKNKLKVLHIWNVTNCGQVIDISGADQQIIGGLIFGLSCALREEITSSNHLVQQSNYHDYQVARMSDVPEITAEFIPSNRRPTGLGEPAVSGVAPALANAIFEATGKRYRSLPLSEHLTI